MSAVCELNATSIVIRKKANLYCTWSHWDNDSGNTFLDSDAVTVTVVVAAVVRGSDDDDDTAAV